MARISKYYDYDEGMYDDQWEDDASDMDDYNKVTRCGLDDPMAMRTVDLNIRLDLLFCTMLAYDVRAEQLIDFLNLMNPKAKDDKALEKLKRIRAKHHPDEGMK